MLRFTEGLLDNLEPFNAATSPPPSSAGYRTGPQSSYSDGSSQQPLNPPMRQTVGSSYPSQYTQSAPSEARLSYATQPRTGKAALIAQQQQNVQEPILYQDSGVRFTGDDQQEPGPSQLPTDVPPTYTPH